MTYTSQTKKNREGLALTIALGILIGASLGLATTGRINTDVVHVALFAIVGGVVGVTVGIIRLTIARGNR